MKKINLQNSTGFSDKMLKIIVNGEIHIMHSQFLTFQVPDDKSFEVKVKYFGDASPVYTFNPKENMAFQISKNRRLINTSWFLLITGLVLSFVIMYFYGDVRFISFVFLMAPLLVAIHQTIFRKKFFVIQEVSQLGKVE